MVILGGRRWWWQPWWWRRLWLLTVAVYGGGSRSGGGGGCGYRWWPSMVVAAGVAVAAAQTDPPGTNYGLRKSLAPNFGLLALKAFSRGSPAFKPLYGPLILIHSYSPNRPISPITILAF